MGESLGGISAATAHLGVRFPRIFCIFCLYRSHLTVNQPKSSAAALLGWNSLVSALSVSPLLRSGLLQVNSRGYSSCSGLSMSVFSTLSCTLLSLHFDHESGVPPHQSSIFASVTLLSLDKHHVFFLQGSFFCLMIEIVTLSSSL